MPPFCACGKAIYSDEKHIHAKGYKPTSKKFVALLVAAKEALFELNEIESLGRGLKESDMVRFTLKNAIAQAESK